MKNLAIELSRFETIVKCTLSEDKQIGVNKKKLSVSFTSGQAVSDRIIFVKVPEVKMLSGLYICGCYCRIPCHIEPTTCTWLRE